jgi:ketosteroid isomerase-like protein
MTVVFVEEFKRYYSHFDQYDIDTLDDFYTVEALFTDPLHSICGRENVKAYFSAMCDGLLSCRFEFVGETVAKESAWLKWVMHYQHPKLNKGEMLQLTGATYLVFSNEGENGDIKVIRHEDFYDMGSMVYEHIPIMGSSIRWLKKQLLS